MGCTLLALLNVVCRQLSLFHGSMEPVDTDASLMAGVPTEATPREALPCTTSSLYHARRQR